MKWYLIFALRSLLFVIGVYFFSHLFFYEPQERRFQKWLEGLWLKIDYLQEQAISKHLAFIRVTAGTLTSVADRFFGPKIISIQSLGVSISFAFVLINIYHLSTKWKYQGFHSIFRDDDLFNLLFYSVWAFVPFWINRELVSQCGAYSDFPTFKSSRCVYTIESVSDNTNWFTRLRSSATREIPLICACSQLWINLWFFYIIVWIYKDYICPCTLTVPELGPEFNALLFGIMTMAATIAALATSLFVIFVFSTRIVLKRISTAKSVVAAVLFLCLGSIPFLVLYGFFKFSLLTFDLFPSPPSMGTDGLPKWDIGTWLPVVLFISFLVTALVNVGFVFATLIFLLLGLLLLAHRVFWPSVSRPIYRLQRIGIAKRTALFAMIGMTLMLVGIGRLEWLKSILKYITHLLIS